MQALQNPWVREGGEASAKQEDTLSSDVVRRLQMFGTFNVLKKTLLRKLAGRISNSRDPQVSPPSLPPALSPLSGGYLLPLCIPSIKF